MVELLLGQGFDGLREVCLLVLSFAAMLPICLMRDISGLEAYSSLSVFTVLVVTAMVVVKAVLKYFQNAGDSGSGGDVWAEEGPVEWGPSHGPNGVVFALGVFSFAFVNQVSEKI